MLGTARGNDMTKNTSKTKSAAAKQVKEGAPITPELQAAAPLAVAQAQAEAAGKPAPSPKRKSSLRDAFGNRLNTRSHIVNLVVMRMTKPLTTRQIEDAANASDEGKQYNALTGADGIGAVRRHIDYLLERGAIIESPEGGFAPNPAHPSYSQTAMGAPKPEAKPAKKTGKK